MESVAIFKHAVRMVFQNLGDAVKVTGVLYLAMFVAQIALIGTLMADDAAIQAAMAAGTMPWGALALYFVIATVLSIWAVIGWHRYVLLEERPAFVPKLLPANMLSYFWRTVLVTLIIIVPAMIAGGLGGFVFGMIGALAGVGGAAIGAAVGSMLGMAIAILVAYRLSPMFPSAALGNSMTFGDAWAKLRGKNGMLIGLAVISAVVIFILSIPTFLLSPSSVIAQAYMFIIGWLQLTIGASIITTLYGVYVEGRSLDLA